MKKYKDKSNLQVIPGVGPSIEKDLQDIGISCINDLIGKKPENLYNKLCKLKKLILINVNYMFLDVQCIT
jgi:predicted RecB family nuclease